MVSAEPSRSLAKGFFRLAAKRSGRRTILSQTMLAPMATGRSATTVTGVFFLRRVTKRQPLASRSEAEIIVAEVEDIGRPGFDEHFLGNGDVVGVARSELVEGGHLGLGVVDDVDLGGNLTILEVRPALRPARMDQGGIDQPQVLLRP